MREFCRQKAPNSIPRIQSNDKCKDLEFLYPDAKTPKFILLIQGLNNFNISADVNNQINTKDEKRAKGIFRNVLTRHPTFISIPILNLWRKSIVSIKTRRHPGACLGLIPSFFVNLNPTNEQDFRIFGPHFVNPGIGMWLSLVEHLVRDQGVVGSNPAIPTRIYRAKTTVPGQNLNLSFSARSSMAELIPDIKSISFEGPESRNPLAFRYYEAERSVLGKKMKDWLRFSVAYWHTFRGTGSDPFGPGTIKRSWDDGSNTVENAIQRMRVNFEFLKKLGVGYYCFHDRDIAPEGSSLSESHKNLDAVIKAAKELQKETGIKLLWGTANLFSNPRFMNGASTNPEAHVFAYAASQVKKAMEVTLELGGENYVFWGGREGYQSFLNTDIKRELDHMARFLQMAANYKKEIGFKGTLLIEPKPKEPTKHQYDFDAATVMGFLKNYGLEKDYKLNIEANHATLAGHSFEHDLEISSRYGMLGSVDANSGDLLLGWDTDQFNMDLRSCTLAMQIIVQQGGLGTGGLNFDAKVRRESTDVEDLFIAHIGGMDCFARGLLTVDKIQSENILPKLRQERYASYDSGIGAKIEAGQTSFQELEKWTLENGEPKQVSGKQEKFEMLLNDYL